MRVSRLSLLPILALTSILIVGCAKDITTQAPIPAEDQVSALFDPSASIVPSPTDLVRSPTTGLVAIPVNPLANAAQTEFEAYLNTLDGFPQSSTVTACFAADLDATTLADNIKVVKLPATDTETPSLVTDITIGTPAQSAACPVLTEKACDFLNQTGCEDGQFCWKTGVCATAGYQVSLSKTAPWEHSSSYAFFVTNGVKTTAGKAIIRSLSFELAAGENPLCEWDATNNVCTYNYSALLASKVKAAVVAANEKSETPLSEEELEAAIKAEILKSATSFEMLRQGYQKLLALAVALGMEKDNVVLAWSFTTATFVEAIFDPSTGLIPGPGNDLIFDATNNKVAIPEPANETPEAKALREGLNTLDGFSTTATYYATFSGKLDASKLANTQEAVDLIVLNLTDLQKPAIGAFGWVDNAGAVTFTPTTPLDENTRYAIVLRSRGNEAPTTAQEAMAAAGGLTDENGRRVVASTAFALARMKNALVDENGKSQVSVLDDETAVALEELRKSYDQVLSALEQDTAIVPAFKREDVAIMWTFKTQSMTDALTSLRALPWEALAAVEEANSAAGPVLTGGIDPTHSSWPTGVPNTSVGGLGKGTFTTWLAIDPTTGAFLPDPTQGTPVDVPFYISLPALADCSTAACANANDTCATLFDSQNQPTAQKYCVPENYKLPVVIFQHGITRAKTDFFGVANALNGAGYAVIAFDINYHGERSVCTSDDDCLATASCSAAGICCDATTTSDCGLHQFAIDDENIPVASGKAFMNAANPFAIRDNMRQHTIDSAALIRALVSGAMANMRWPLVDLSNGTPNPVPVPTIDAANINYVGHSLGSILGSQFIATESNINRAVLNVPGAPVVDIFVKTENEDFQAIVKGLLKGNGLCDANDNCPYDSVGALKLFHILQWIVDPGDAANFAKYVKTEQLKDLVATEVAGTDVMVPAKDVLFQIAGKDSVIPTELQESLAAWMGIDVTDSTYSDSDHGFIFNEGLTTASAQTQMVKFLLTGQVCKPNTAAGTCE